MKAHGFINAGPNQALLSNMPDGPLVSALEMKYDRASPLPVLGAPVRRCARVSRAGADHVSARGAALRAAEQGRDWRRGTNTSPRRDGPGWIWSAWRRCWARASRR